MLYVSFVELFCLRFHYFIQEFASLKLQLARMTEIEIENDDDDNDGEKSEECDVETDKDESADEDFTDKTLANKKRSSMRKAPFKSLNQVKAKKPKSSQLKQSERIASDKRMIEFERNSKKTYVRKSMPKIVKKSNGNRNHKSTRNSGGKSKPESLSELRNTRKFPPKLRSKAQAKTMLNVRGKLKSSITDK